MDLTKRIVTQAPLEELWNDNGPLDARRGERAGETEIVRLLQDGSTFVVADAGLPLRWISADDRFAFWKDEVKYRLVALDADRFDVCNYPGSYCYVATMWPCASLGPVIVLEKHH
ncbi:MULTISPECIES: hypothetical protein [unclassified Bradyrhizobium]|uniref:hypothetical protein n=1 Tax=unclassified Bradyrhizobium TaxID=2631580 RepID=UPI0024789CD4|nr:MULTISPECIES: hypothetical protein [unclassified Bradyrhizobium]WGS23465.1 hypothetical protein MTX22_18685 [Bradyrhizobium sp. ISRA463]WGS30482.1 hypothetical protein MTX19_16410 [Bradyrhizobium sp. ISRA464]